MFTKEESVIRQYMVKNQFLHDAELSRTLGLERRILPKRFKSPETMRLHELRSIIDELHISYLDILAIVLGDKFDEGKAKKEID